MAGTRLVGDELFPRLLCPIKQLEKTTQLFGSAISKLPVVTSSDKIKSPAYRGGRHEHRVCSTDLMNNARLVE
jgi:hypothetical protein